MEQHHNNVPFHPPLYQLPQQTQMTSLNNVPQMQLPFPQQVYNQQRPLYDMCDYPTGGAPLLPPLPLQVSHGFLIFIGCFVLKFYALIIVQVMRFFYVT